MDTLVIKTLEQLLRRARKRPSAHRLPTDAKLYYSDGEAVGTAIDYSKAKGNCLELTAEIVKLNTINLDGAKSKFWAVETGANSYKRL
ncbi:hypothetical protein EV178_005141 [Coemansia sp. RSA 1646]|nr:hypothetical protein EV178_005141 [Coemansia sp. RSA 1646]